MLTKGLLTFVPRVFFLRKRNVLFLCYHRKRVVTKQTLDVLKKMDFFVGTTGNGWSQNRLLTSGTRVFYPVNVGIGSSMLTKGLLTFVPRVFFLRKRNVLFLCYHRKRVVTKQTLDVLKKMDFFVGTTGNGWSQNRLLTSGTRVFYPVNVGIGSSMLTKGLLTFVPRVFFLRKKNGLFLCYHRKRVVTKQTLDVRNSCLLPC
jgi:hypothetical protein